MRHRSLKKAAPWAALDSFGGSAINFVTIFILSRILLPAEFGVVSYAQAIVGIVQLISAAGLSQALVQRRPIDVLHYDSAFWASTLLGALGWLVCIALAALSMRSTDDWPLALVIISQGSTCLFGGLSTVPSALLQRKMRMAALARRTVLSRVAYLLTACGLGAMGYGLYSIIIAVPVQSVVAAISIWYSAPRWPKFRLSWEHLRQLLSYGWAITADGALWASLNRVFSILVASFHSLEVLGYVSIAMRTTDALASLLQNFSDRLAFPMLSALSADPEKMKDFFARATEAMAFVSTAAYIGLMLTARDWVPIILGQRWISVVPMVQVLCAIWTITFSRAFVATYLRAMGRPRAGLATSVVAATVTAAAVPATAGMAPIFVIFAWALRVAITIPVSNFLLKRFAGIGYMAQTKPLVRPYLCAAAMTCGLLLLRPEIESLRFSSQNLGRLCVSVAAGAVLYGAAAAVLYRRAVLQYVSGRRRPLAPPIRASTEL